MGAPHDSTDVGTRFAEALAAKDRAALAALLHPDVDFRGLTPGSFWEAGSAAELVDDILLGQWFAPTDRIDALESVEVGEIVDRRRVGYRLRVTNEDGVSAVEQQAYYEAPEGRITWLRVMCAGYRPLD